MILSRWKWYIAPLAIALLGVMLCPLKSERGDFLNTPLLFLGFALNLAGTIMYFSGQ